MIRSARAGEFARTSTQLKVLGILGSGLMTAQASTKILNDRAAPIDYVDFVVGAGGFSSGIAEIGGYNIPYVGEVVALYSWTRFWMDLGYNNGPGTWFQPDNQESILLEYMKKNGY